MKTITVLLFALLALGGCVSPEARVNPANLVGLEGHWTGVHQLKHKSSSGEKMNFPPFPGFRRFCDVEIRKLTDPIEDFTHGLFVSIDMDYIDHHSRKSDYDNVLTFLGKLEDGEVVFYALADPRFGTVKVSSVNAFTKYFVKKDVEELRIKFVDFSNLLVEGRALRGPAQSELSLNIERKTSNQ